MPYRSWCTYCVSGKRNDDPHRSKDGDDEEDPGAPATVEFDYAFPSVDEEEPEDEELELTVLAGFDRRTKGILAVMAREKGP